MVSFALITEGITDQAVLENILAGLYGDDVEVKILQPLRDATDESRAKSDSLGGWWQVFKHFQDENFHVIFGYNDYVIIQIETDVCENFGVPLLHNGNERPIVDLVNNVREKLIEKIRHPAYDKYKSQFNFAIAVDCLECWLLPLYAKQPAHFVKNKHCSNQLERDTKRLGLDYRKDYRTYDDLNS